ncbi:MAG TPA: sigma-70 family RNA polymerase sigma factor, partial [Kofleriaceae bacterium]|nr:sigma-70 family RNA polymerase sigma factor [Kofleriaceae bacterium]
MAMDPEPPDPSALPAPEAPTERELLEQPVKRAATAGDSTAATTAALRLYGGEVYAFLVSTAGSASLADEAYSDLCEVVWRQLCDFRWEASLRSWMYSVARKLALRHRVDGYRRQQRARPLELAPEVEALAAEIRVSTLEILRTSVKDGFRLLRAELPAEEQELLLLRVDREMSWRDIARVLEDGPPQGGAGRADDGEPADLDRKAAALRKRFERVRDRLRALPPPAPAHRRWRRSP